MTSDRQHPTLLVSIDEHVLVARHQFYLRSMRSSGGLHLELPAKLMSAGQGGAVFLSGGTDHIASVTFEVWTAEPEPDHRCLWEMSERGMLDVDVANLVFMTGNGGNGPEHRIPTAGPYAIRAYCKGRTAVADAEIGDDLVYPSGLEQWLIQLWVAQASV